ncbi:hypothetical protein BZA05DRAFT_401610 [Tricharina praecox]|uniref:uncharacterized protein n=1 Tax=Tricharina praecox TaxID=43433 RepID=UPI002221055E|nr:uncharacterized protein BZA05DRAFT_401610 [Tricharina praecox]KAI5849806.1 hypothetical protein BZA05DRAFT_401610 [Tricharina praecox]
MSEGKGRAKGGFFFILVSSQCSAAIKRLCLCLDVAAVAAVALLQLVTRDKRRRGSDEATAYSLYTGARGNQRNCRMFCGRVFLAGWLS